MSRYLSTPLWGKAYFGGKTKSLGRVNILMLHLKIISGLRWLKKMMIIFPLAFILEEVVIRVNFRDPPGISRGRLGDVNSQSYVCGFGQYKQLTQAKSILTKAHFLVVNKKSTKLLGLKSFCHWRSP